MSPASTTACVLVFFCSIFNVLTVYQVSSSGPDVQYFFTILPHYSEWIYGCRYLYGNTEAERAAAERLVMESQRTMEDTNKTTQRLVFENKKRTGEHYIYW